MNQTPAAALPELREAEAPPEIAAIYAALRRASGIPLVNLIWRHLATMPGVLPWAWEAVRPPLEDGRLAAARDRLAGTLVLPPGLEGVDAAAWQRAGLAEAERASVLAMVAAYNRGNLTNLILLTALREAMEGQATARSAPPLAAIAPPPMLPPLPPLPVLATLPATMRTLVEGLAASHGPPEARGGVVPSLYLHLAHWPALLQALPGWLAPLLGRPGTIADLRDAAIAAGAAEARALALGPVPPTPGGHGPAVAAALRRFTGQVIPEMVPVGLALHRILAKP